jgi:phospholipid/cholesterol/gamma-HCH transport system substrate-binding protein
MELSYKEEVGVGALVLVGLVAFTAGLFWLTGRSIGSRGVAAKIEFTNVSGLKEGDPVRVSGVRKGRVSDVRLDRVGRVIVTLQLDPEVRPHRDASATVASADFLGTKYIDYNPGVSDTLLVDGTPIKGVAEDQFADVASRAATSANELIARMNEGLNPGEIATEIRATLQATQRGMAALTSAANGPVVRQTQMTLAAVERVMARFDTLLGASNPSQTGARFDSLAANMARLTSRLADATASLKTMLDKIERGEGTMGKMATDTVLYRNMNETLTSLNALLTDLRERPGRYLTVKVF